MVRWQSSARSSIDMSSGRTTSLTATSRSQHLIAGEPDPAHPAAADEARQPVPLGDELTANRTWPPRFPPGDEHSRPAHAGTTRPFVCFRGHGGAAARRGLRRGWPRGCRKRAASGRDRRRAEGDHRRLSTATALPAALDDLVKVTDRPAPGRHLVRGDAGQPGRAGHLRRAAGWPPRCSTRPATPSGDGPVLDAIRARDIVLSPVPRRRAALAGVAGDGPRPRRARGARVPVRCRPAHPGRPHPVRRALPCAHR